ncbi:MAG: CoA transferase subunit A, partial [Actinobacteria bacterium]|nr:CoA transferase subunit A [Actinomycetota bacterium]
MKEKLTTLSEAVSRISSGSTIAIGGSMIRRQPNALARELIRQGKSDLTILTFAAGTATDLLAAAGAVRCWEGIYSGLFWYGQSYNFRKGVESGTIEVRDFSESAMVARLR